MNVTKSDLDEERKYLEEVLGVIERRGVVAHGAMQARRGELGALKKYVWESQRDLDLVELTEHRRSANLDALRVEANHRQLAKLSRARKSPFFGRLDFTEESGEAERLYIGLTQIEEGNQFFVYDWRAPISSMFYEFGLGAASYEAPVGKISGTISRRRQFKIVDGVITQCFDTDQNVADEFLQEVLSQSSSEKMRQVVTTIQREQNTIIRNTEDRFLIVQGVAGSGKTSVALHRVAYLLYKDKRLHSNNVLIFSPNSVFSEYISDVLPDLGEENTLQTTFSDFAQTYLAECGEVESFAEFIEQAYSGDGLVGGGDVTAVEWKLSDGLRELVDKFAMKTLSQARLTFGIFVKGREYAATELTAKFRAAAGETFTEKLEHLADVISDEAGFEYEDPRDGVYRELLDKLQSNFRLGRLYTKFLSWARAFAPKGVVKGESAHQPGGRIAYEDSIAMLYLKFKLFGFPRDTGVLHVVIDEAQDYTLLQMEIMGRIFEKAAFTVLGDVNQTVNPFYRHESLGRIAEAFRGRSGFVELSKAYRSTREIVEFANEILEIENVSAIREQRSAPVVKKDASQAEFVGKVREDVQEMVQAGMKSIAIITKTAAEAARLFEELRGEMSDLEYVSRNSQRFSKKLVLLPSYLAKGLEFDGVICYLEGGKSFSERERRLYYVVCTRAQHRLVVYESPAPPQ
jgi:DNA helicase-2/ATP-dependent DNA helicase PcrA